MADTTTTNYGLTKPGINEAAGDSLWGQKLNTNFDTIDTNMKRIDNAAASGGGGGGGAPSAQIAGANGATVVAAAADKGKVYVLAGSGTLQFPSAVQVAGWYAYVRKNDNVLGAWALTPTGTPPTIDGKATIYCYQEDFVVYWDSSASVFRTQGRDRGWIPMGTTSVSAGVSTVNFTLGFNDTELRDIEVVGENVVPNAADYTQLKIMKGGSYLSAGYIGNTFTWNGATGGTAPASAIPLAYRNTTAAAAFKATVYGFQGTVTARVATEAINADNGQISLSHYQNTSTASAPQGIQVSMAAANAINTGTFHQRGFRL